MIRVLHVVTYMGRGGLETMLMNYYRHINHDEVQFDFLVDGYEHCIIEEEVKMLGGKLYKIEPYRSNIFKYMQQIYKIVKTIIIYMSCSICFFKFMLFL